MDEPGEIHGSGQAEFSREQGAIVFDGPLGNADLFGVVSNRYAADNPQQHLFFTRSQGFDFREGLLLLALGGPLLITTDKRPLDGPEQFFCRDSLREKIFGTGLDRPNTRRDVALSRHEDNGERVA